MLNKNIYLNYDISMSICTNCGNEIPKQRLDLFPETNLCSAKCIENIIESEKNVHLDAAPPAPTGEKATCPRCKSRLEVRKGPTGWFLGCTRYPMCKGTKQL